MGAMRTKHKTGERFGKLVIKRMWSEQFNAHGKEAVCECKCDCGGITVTRLRNLKEGGKRSCGCDVQKRHKEHHAWRGHGDIPHTIWTRIKRSAKRHAKQLDFAITIQEAWELYQKQNGKCALSGTDIAFSERVYGKYIADTTASLDRIDSNKGYTVGNIQWVHKEINQMKWSLGQDTFIDWCHRVANKFPVPNATAGRMIICSLGVPHEGTK